MAGALTPVNERLKLMNHPAQMAMKNSALSADTYKAMDKRKEVHAEQEKHTSTLEDVTSWVGVMGSFVGSVAGAFI